MDRTDYANELALVLQGRAAEVSDRLSRFWTAADDDGTGIDGIVIEVFVDQDGEGPFDVWARFIGDDAFTLDRRFDEQRHVFGVEWGEDGWEPDVPGRPRGWTRDDLEGAVLSVVTEWIEPLIPDGSPEGFWQIGTPNEFSA